MIVRAYFSALPDVLAQTQQAFGHSAAIYGEARMLAIGCTVFDLASIACAVPAEIP